MKERILQLITRLGYTSTRFADEIGVQRSGISHILSGRNQPSYDLIIKILNRFPDINADWFLLGKGTMLKSPEATEITTPDNKKKPHPVAKEPNLFSGTSPDKETINPAPEDFAQVTNVTSMDRLIVLYSNGTFDVYQQAKKE